MSTEKAPRAAVEITIRLCPICRRTTSAAYAPFCSKRCADVDLHRWLGGVYAVPDEEPAPFQGDDEP